jgi:DtxR family Mn-dependent transcriptional regulator
MASVKFYIHHILCRICEKFSKFGQIWRICDSQVAIKALKKQGLLEHNRYSTVSLTKKGAVQAAEIRKRHSLLTIFLHNVVEVDSDNAEKDACKMEHILSKETLEKIEKLVNEKN